MAENENVSPEEPIEEPQQEQTPDASEATAPEAAEILSAEELVEDAAAAPAADEKKDDDKKKDAGKKKSGVSGGTIVASVVAVIAIVAAVAIYMMNSVPSGAAAKIGDKTYLSESDVTAYVDQYRSSYSMTDDATWASSLISQSMTPAAWRINCIETLAKSEIIYEEAKKQNVAPTDDEIQSQIDSMKTSMGADDSTWASTLEQYGYTEDSLKTQIRNSLAQSNLLAAAVPKPDGYEEAISAANNVETDSDGNAKKKKEQDILDNANTLYSQWQTDCSIYLANLQNDTSITIYPMPSGLSYDVDLSLASSASEE